jgi:hypothetical protein
MIEMELLNSKFTEKRPVPCRGFNCRENEKWKVWVDYENAILNPQLHEQITNGNGGVYSW